MMYTNQALFDLLRQSLLALDKQIGVVMADLEKQIAVMPYPEEVTVYDIKDGSGKNPMTDLHVARAQVVSAMANLKAAEMQGKKPSRGW